jgi:hypothetical protein
LVTSPPKLHSLLLLHESSSSAVVLRLFLTQPFALEVYSDGL